MTLSVFFIIGFTAVSVQAVFFREFLSVFYGNELTAGLFLLSWIAGGSCGSYFFAKRTLLKEITRIRLVRLMFTLSVIMPASLALLLQAPILAGSFGAQSQSLIVTAAIALTAVFPINMILGAMFSQTFSYGFHSEIDNIATAYMLEALGAFFGGIISVFVLFYLSTSSQIILILSIVILLYVILLSRDTAIRLLTFALLTLYSISLPKAESFEINIAKRSYPASKIIMQKNTRYQKITLAKTENQLNLYTNHQYSFSNESNYYSEFFAHLPMLYKDNPKNILLIGGGLSDISKELLKHPLNQLIYLEIDPDILKLAKYFGLPDDKRYKLVNSYPRNFLSKTELSFDVILLDMPSPGTIFLNRFYTLEFFKKVYGSLSNNGIFSFSLPSNPNALSGGQEHIFRIIISTLKEVFPDIILIPGETAFIMASKEKNAFNVEKSIIRERLHKRHINTTYFEAFYFSLDFSDERMQEINRLLNDRNNSAFLVNKDLHPRAYLSNNLLWISGFYPKIQVFLGFFNNTAVYALSILLLITVSVSIFRRRSSVLYLKSSVFTAGFSSFALQIIIIYIFQILHASIFWKISMLTASFMLGAAVGAMIIKSKFESYKVSINTLFILQLAFIIYAFILLITAAAGQIIRIPELILILMPVIPGYITGMQMPAAALLLQSYSKETKDLNPGKIYSWELAGAAAAAMTYTLILIPSAGILNSIYFIIIMHMFTAAVLAREA